LCCRPVARLKTTTLNTDNSIIPYRIGRSCVLYGSLPSAQKITAGVNRNGVHVVNSIAELIDQTSLSRNQDGSNCRHINSIIILACSGDDISALANIYKIASDINVLVTTIIVNNSSCIPISSSNTLTDLRASSDIVVITSDENYLEYMLDCLL
jgi:hypothetical protein